MQPACISSAPRPWHTTGAFAPPAHGLGVQCTSISSLRMSMRSWSMIESCWLESVCDAVGNSLVELNELCVPIHGAFASGTSFPSAYWRPSARWVHDDW